MIAKTFQMALFVGLVLAAGCQKERESGSTVSRTYTVAVDYDTPLAELATAEMYPGYFNPNITEANFPAERSGTAEVKIEIVHLDRAASTQEVKAEIKRRGLRPVTLRELLALGAKDKELGHEFPVVALGSEWTNPGGDLFVPCVRWRAGGRRLHLHWSVGGWLASCRFAAVRE